ncbi:flavin-containing monooxygenase 5 [Caerostris extrusa]|uniref:Flavin-containing monooxygenase n=1 Tax=Caerostris extrusa TaxID=172846 RepID=A0AAV4XR19_CAEEX|nr:flavin-containing monooxygenase 5 [Caerostris extrusa]
MAQPKKIAIIGAGPSGLTAIKSCKEEGFLPVCFERNGDPGGLWRYHDEDIEGVASVMKTTIINTSKELSAFSDFPPRKNTQISCTTARCLITSCYTLKRLTF